MQERESLEIHPGATIGRRVFIDHGDSHMVTLEAVHHGRAYRPHRFVASIDGTCQMQMGHQALGQADALTIETIVIVASEANVADAVVTGVDVRDAAFAGAGIARIGGPCDVLLARQSLDIRT